MFLAIPFSMNQSRGVRNATIHARPKLHILPIYSSNGNLSDDYEKFIWSVRKLKPCTYAEKSQSSYNPRSGSIIFNDSSTQQ